MGECYGVSIDKVISQNSSCASTTQSKIIQVHYSVFKNKKKRKPKVMSHMLTNVGNRRYIIKRGIPLFWNGSHKRSYKIKNFLLTIRITSKFILSAFSKSFLVTKNNYTKELSYKFLQHISFTRKVILMLINLGMVFP